MNTMTNKVEMVEGAMRDAHAAFVAAVADNRWMDVAKYAAQVAELRAERARLDGGIVNFHGMTGSLSVEKGW